MPLRPKDQPTVQVTIPTEAVHEAVQAAVKEALEPLAPAMGQAIDQHTQRLAQALETELVKHGNVMHQIAAKAAADAVCSAHFSAVAHTWRAVAGLLAVRYLLALSMVGGFSLALLALMIGTWQAAGAVLAYAVLIFLPLVYLETRPREGRPDASAEGAE